MNFCWKYVKPYDFADSLQKCLGFGINGRNGYCLLFLGRPQDGTSCGFKDPSCNGLSINLIIFLVWVGVANDCWAHMFLIEDSKFESILDIEEHLINNL